MRMFISLNFSDEIKKEITLIGELIKKQNFIKGKITDYNNLHLTLKFLGEVEKNKIPEIISTLEKIKFSSFEVKINNIGIFNNNLVRIIWVKIEGAEELQKEIDNALSDFYKKEERFMSHITIARVKEVSDKNKLFEFLDKTKIKNISTNVNSFSLMSSELTQKGPVYKEIKMFKLNN